MKRQFLFITASALVLIAALLTAGCTSATPGDGTKTLPATTPVSPGDAPGTLPVTTIVPPGDTPITLPVISVTSPTDNRNTLSIPTITDSGSTSSSCQFTSCHGLNLACGMSEPRMCTMEYQLGDKCRQYAQCTSGSDGTCSLVKSPEFDSCVSCVKSCSRDAGTDSVAAFDCEAQC